MYKTINELSCEIACAVYEKFQQDAYALRNCGPEYDIEDKKIILDFLKYYSDKTNTFCDLNNIKNFL